MLSIELPEGLISKDASTYEVFAYISECLQDSSDITKLSKRQLVNILFGDTYKHYENSAQFLNPYSEEYYRLAYNQITIPHIFDIDQYKLSYKHAIPILNVKGDILLFYLEQVLAAKKEDGIFVSQKIKYRASGSWFPNKSSKWFDYKHTADIVTNHNVVIDGIVVNKDGHKRVITSPVLLCSKQGCITKNLSVYAFHKMLDVNDSLNQSNL